ncbi:ABC transporter substrate-binding protein [Spirillospora albida]|uniref:ABC transporter substrate-binding protein n=1 Tax=Spirillospora albida TaxID=58123 RepID=UPI00068994A2|nr:ABC transporter substrate-binding protein [Spirillospora albida]
MPEIAPLRPGDPDRLGPYRLTGLIGEGGQGAVFLGEDEDGDQVAVKLLHARFSGDRKARSRFAAEVDVAKRVSAFCTARILDSHVEDDRPYIVSEYIDGPSLAAVLAEDGPRRGADLDRVAIGTMTAIAAIHQAGVVHRDFKPANVLLAADGPRVIDFGIAKALDATGTLSSTAIGTPAYMAPEQISGAPVGPAADVWAWGATMVYAATGRPAFGQDTIPAVMHRILNRPPDMDGLQEPLRSVVEDCLAKDPALRPGSLQVLSRLLTLAGSLPAPAGAPEGNGGTGMLTQGVEAASADSGRLAALQAPPPPQATPRQPSQQAAHQAQPSFQPPPPAPGPPSTPPPWTPPHGTPPHGAPPPGQGPEGAVPQGPTWPQGNGPLMGTGKARPPARRRGIGVLAAAGGAALVALIVAGTAITVQLTKDRDKGTEEGRVGGALEMTAAQIYTTDGEIDPSHSYSGTERFIAKQLFTGLTELGPDGGARNRLATSITPDALCENWTIRIREGTTFSNGDPVDAEAFRRGWSRSAATAGGAGPVLMADIDGFSQAAHSSGLTGVTASGNTLTVKLTSANCDFPARLSDPVFAPLPDEAGASDDKTFNQAPIGNGPFKLESYRTGTDGAVILVRNDTWAFGRTKLDRVVVNLVSSSSEARRNGDLGWAHLDSGDFPSISLNDVTTGPAPYTQMLVPLVKRGPMASKDARLAVSHALDRNRLSRVYGGVYRPARALVPPAVPGHAGAATCSACAGPDAAKAKELAERAGLGSGTSIRLYVQESTTAERITDQVASTLRETLGWKVELKKTPASRYDDFRKAVVADDASGLALFSWGPDYPSGHTMLWPLLGSTGLATADNPYSNYSGWTNKRFDELMGNALRNQSIEGRRNVFQEAERLALDDMALIPLLHFGYAARISPRYVGLTLDYHGDPTLATAALK